MNIFRKVILLTMMIFIGAVHFAHAEDVSVAAEVDTHTVQAGSPVLLMLTINGAEGIDPVKLPEIKGFQARFLGPRTQISIVNGQSHRSTSFMYNLYGTELGKFEIPAIPITVNNQTYTTNPVPIEVVDKATASSGSPGQADQAVKDKVLLVINIPNKEYFVNEKIPLSFKLYIAQDEQVNLASNIDFKRPGFDIDDIVDSNRYQETVGGQIYNVIEFKTFVYPRQAGEQVLGPAQLLAKIRGHGDARQQSPFADMPNVFGDDFFNNFLNDDWQEQLVKSADMTLKVLPTPEEGKPKDFSGGVGKFNFDVSVSPTEVKVGDPITLRMKLSGEGSLKNVNFPQLTDPRFKFYTPQVHEDKGEKILEQVAIPTTEQIKEFPAVSFSYFDTEKRQYETITKGPFPLSVTKGDNAPATIIGNTTSEPPQPPPPTPLDEKLGQGISFIKDAPGTFVVVGAYLYQSPAFIFLIFILALLWIAAFVAYHITHKFKTDTVFARRFLAPRKARKDLSEAKHHLDKGEQKEFYDRLSKTLQDYLSSKSHQRSIAMTIENIAGLLKGKDIKLEILNDINGLLQEFEMVRFASIKVSKEKMEASFVRVQEIIDYLERNWS